MHSACGSSQDWVLPTRRRQLWTLSVLLITVARVSLGMKLGCSARVFDPSPRCATSFTWTLLVHVQTSDRLPELASLKRAQSSWDRQIQRTVRLRLTFYCRIPVKREIEICISNNTPEPNLLRLLLVHVNRQLGSVLSKRYGLKWKKRK